MSIWNPLFNKKKEQYRKEGLELEQQGKYEEAYIKYEEAGGMDDIPSMLYIARMYLSGNFRPVETSNLGFDNIPSFRIVFREKNPNIDGWD